MNPSRLKRRDLYPHPASSAAPLTLGQVGIGRQPYSGCKTDDELASFWASSVPGPDQRPCFAISFVASKQSFDTWVNHFGAGLP